MPESESAGTGDVGEDEEVDRGHRHDAFISYHSASSKPAAKYLQRELEDVARRSVGDTPVRIFRDATHLTYADLRETIEEQLRNSRRLVLVLHRSTKDSAWVDAEVRYWLANGGSPRRLILARADPELDLSWDGEANRFTHEDSLPASLRDVYTSEPLWIDVSSRRLGRPAADEGEIARLCATLLERDPADLLQREIRVQRSRRRRLRAVVASLVMLLVVAVAATVVALRSTAEAERQQTEAEAQAQAAEALLTAEERPDRALELLTHASARSEGQSVRAAMLSVIDGSRRLERMIAVADDLGGAAPDDLFLDESGHRLAAWRDDAGRVRLGVWDAVTGRNLVATRLPEDAANVSGLVLVGQDRAAFCTSTGPRLVRLSGDTVTEEGRLDASSCDVGLFRGGAVLIGWGAGSSAVLVVDAESGDARRFDSIAFAGVEPLSDVVVLQQHGRPTVAVGAGLVETPIVAPPDVGIGELVDLDEWGRLVVRTASGQYWRGPAAGDTSSGGEYFPVPAGSLAADAVGGAFPGYVWVTPEARLAWSYGPQTVDLSAHRTAPAMRPNAREVDLEVSPDGTQAVVLFRTTAEGLANAVVVDLTTHPYEPAMTVGEPIGWLADSFSVGRESFVLYGGEDGGHIVDRLGVERVDGTPYLDPTGRHVVVFGGEALLLHPYRDEPVVLDRGSDTRAVAYSGDGALLAVARPAGPVSIYSTAPESELPGVAEVEQLEPAATASFGQVTYASVAGGVLRDSATDGLSTVLTDTEEDTARVRNASPDGERVLVELSPGGVVGHRSEEGEFPPVLLVHDNGEKVDVSEHCPQVDGRFLAFRPGARFTESLEDAEAQLLVDQLDMSAAGDNAGEWQTIDCATGREVAPTVTSVLDYQLDAQRGLIVASDGDGVDVTTWLRGDAASLSTTTLPGVEGDASVRLDDDGTTAVVWRPGAAAVSVLERDGDDWRASHVIGSAMEDIVAARVSTAAGLLVAASSSGQVQLFDLESGRLVLRTDTGQSGDGGAVDMDTREENGLLSARLGFEGEDSQPTGGVVIRVPVSVDRLRDLLCAKASDAAAC